MQKGVTNQISDQPEVSAGNITKEAPLSLKRQKTSELLA